MTNHEPPRLALALLERLVPDSGSLAGDLIEGFRDHPSRLRVWREVAGAIATEWSTRPDEIRPLRLVDLQPTDALERTRAMHRRVDTLNVTASPLTGISGLGASVLLAVMTFAMPAAWLLYLGSVAAGVALGIVMIATHEPRTK